MADRLEQRTQGGRPSVTIVICTYNRAELLRNCLAAIAAQQTPALDLEVLVVDNNSDDDTAAVAKSFASTLPFRYTAEGRQGLSIARNTGAALARSEYVAFIDDDATIAPGYLDRLAAVISEHRPDLIGGPVIPSFEIEPPEWFDPAMVTRQLEDKPGFSRTATLTGANFITRRDVVDRLGGFPTALGLRGNSLRFGEDRAFVERYRQLTPADRQRLYYDPALSVSHFTSADKLTKRYQLKRHYLNAVAREQIFIATGRRHAPAALVLAGGRIALVPLTALGMFVRQGWNARSRFNTVVHLADSIGRFVGAVQIIASGPPDLTH